MKTINQAEEGREHIGAAASCIRQLKAHACSPDTFSSSKFKQIPGGHMNGKIEELESFLQSKEELLMDQCMKSQYIISESDVAAKHYSLLDADIEQCHDFIVSTEWTIEGIKGKFDLVVVKKWTERYANLKHCFKEHFPYYAVEYKIDDSSTKYGKGHQVQDFVKDVTRLDEKCSYLRRAFALFYYRGPIRFKGNEFDKKSPNYLFKNKKITNKDKLNVYFVDRFGIHRLDLY